LSHLKKVAHPPRKAGSKKAELFWNLFSFLFTLQSSIQHPTLSKQGRWQPIIDHRLSMISVSSITLLWQTITRIHHHLYIAMVVYPTMNSLAGIQFQTATNAMISVSGNNFVQSAPI
jgi:hypothetical protein